jgi:hypothetical protein
MKDSVNADLACSASPSVRVDWLPSSRDRVVLIVCFLLVLLPDSPCPMRSSENFCPEAGLCSATFPKQAFFTYLTFRSRLSDAQRLACNYSFAHCFASSDPRLISPLPPTILTRVEDGSLTYRMKNFRFAERVDILRARPLRYVCIEFVFDIDN